MLDILFFSVGIIFYLAGIHFLVKLHKFVNLRFGWPNPRGISNILFCYLIFAIFIVTVIPVTIFFPIWLNSVFQVAPDTETTRAILLLSGSFVLGLVMWANYRQQNGGINRLGL